VPGPLSLSLPPQVVADLSDELPALTDEVLAAIAREVPAYARPLEGAFGAGVRSGVQVALGRFLSLTRDRPEDGGSERAAVGREIYAELGRGEARVGRPLEALLGAYRVGARVAWDRLADVGLRNGMAADVLVQLAGAVFAYIDELSAASADGFSAEQSVLAGDRERRRTALTQLLLSEAPVRALEEAAQVAGWVPPATLTAVLLPARLGREVAARWDARTLMVADEGEDTGTALLLLPDADGPGQGVRLARLVAGSSAVVGLARPWHQAGSGVALVRRAAAFAGRDPVAVADLLGRLVVTGDPLALGELAELRLAPFARLTPAGRTRLLDTLRSWLAHQGDRRQVAEDLGIHPQTVRYRVGLLRDLLGEELDDPVRRFEWQLVLSQPRD
jgi:PucR C-terminal helix-turn-helix domain